MVERAGEAEIGLFGIPAFAVHAAGMKVERGQFGPRGIGKLAQRRGQPIGAQGRVAIDAPSVFVAGASVDPQRVVFVGAWREQERGGHADRDLDQAPDRSAAISNLIAASPLARAHNRMITPDEVAASVCYLVSDDALMITGTCSAPPAASAR